MMTSISDFYRYKRKFKAQLTLLNKERGLKENKKFVEEFINEKLYGVDSKIKLNEGRATTIVFQLRFAVRNVDKSFYYCEEKDFKKLIQTLRKKGRSNDSVVDFVVILKQFMQFIRKNYEYPEGHKNYDTPLYLLTLLKCPPELAQIYIKRDTLKKRVAKNIKKLPINDTLPWDLVDFTINKRDACLLAMLAENGNRIGGLATLNISDVIIQKDIVNVYISDKTLDNEIVVFFHSKKYIEDWLKIHPFRDNQNAPFFVSLKGDKLNFLTPNTFAEIINRTMKRYNHYANQHDMPYVHVTSRTFRNISTRRDIKAKVPLSIIKRQRGWAPNSQMPELYAAISAIDVTDYIIKENKINIEKKENICPKCRQINLDGKDYCVICGEGLNPTAKEMQKNVEQLVVAVLEDDNLRKMVFEKIKEKEELK